MQQLSIRDDLQPFGADAATFSLPEAGFRVQWGADKDRMGLWEDGLVLLSPLSHEAVSLQLVDGLYVCMDRALNLTHEVSINLQYHQQYQQQYQQYQQQYHQQYQPYHQQYGEDAASATSATAMAASRATRSASSCSSSRGAGRRQAGEGPLRGEV